MRTLRIEGDARNGAPAERGAVMPSPAQPGGAVCLALSHTNPLLYLVHASWLADFRNPAFHLGQAQPEDLLFLIPEDQIRRAGGLVDM